MPPEENKQAIARPDTATPDIMEKGSRGADFFSTMDPGSIQQIQAGPGPFDPVPEVGSPQASITPQSTPPESSD